MGVAWIGRGCIAAGMLFLAACGAEGPPVDEAAEPGRRARDAGGAVEVVVVTPVPPGESSVSPGATRTKGEEANRYRPAILTGHDFSGDAYRPPENESEGRQVLKHFGSLSAKAELPGGAVAARITLNARPANGSLPVVSLILERTGGGRYWASRILSDYTVRANDVVTTSVAAPPGTYRVTLQYYKASPPGRPYLELQEVALE